MPKLVLGPLLRHVGRTTATVWVETDGRCEIDVLGTTAHTWRVGSHYYALVCIDGLAPDSVQAYRVLLDGEQVWPEADSDYPPSVIRTLSDDRPLTVVFGSCRWATPGTVDDPKVDHDALDALATRLTKRDAGNLPDLLVLLGDQVYADETSPGTAARISEHRDTSRPPGTQVANFEEYTWLYAESWGDRGVRWLLSTVPSAMIFDDHDIRDDWNTSAAWREDMSRTDWWEERIIGGLSSYWVYQHLGNMSLEALESDETFCKVRDVGRDGDAEQLLREFAAAADREADGEKGARWSHSRDLGHTRLLVIDSRCGRILAAEERSMVSESEFRWIEEQARGEHCHLLIGTSLPWLLPRALHDLEAWNEAVCAGSRGPRLARVGEKVRRAADFEHWAAFRQSFDRLARLIASVGRGELASTGEAPATICVLSGDVHHSYVARAHLPDKTRSAVFQLTVSPVHNYVPRNIQHMFRASWTRAAEHVTRWLGRFARVPPASVEWRREAGPFFGNVLGTLTLEDRHAVLLVERTGIDEENARRLTPVARMTLA